MARVEVQSCGSSRSTARAFVDDMRTQAEAQARGPRRPVRPAHAGSFDRVHRDRRARGDHPHPVRAVRRATTIGSRAAGGVQIVLVNAPASDEVARRSIRCSGGSATVKAPCPRSTLRPPAATCTRSRRPVSAVGHDVRLAVGRVHDRRRRQPRRGHVDHKTSRSCARRRTASRTRQRCRTGPQDHQGYVRERAPRAVTPMGSAVVEIERKTRPLRVRGGLDLRGRSRSVQGRGPAAGRSLGEPIHLRRPDFSGSRPFKAMLGTASDPSHVEVEVRCRSAPWAALRLPG